MASGGRRYQSGLSGLSISPPLFCRLESPLSFAHPSTPLSWEERKSVGRNTTRIGRHSKPHELFDSIISRGFPCSASPSVVAHRASKATHMHTITNVYVRGAVCIQLLRHRACAQNIAYFSPVSSSWCRKILSAEKVFLLRRIPRPFFEIPLQFSRKLRRHDKAVGVK